MKIGEPLDELPAGLIGNSHYAEVYRKAEANPGKWLPIEFDGPRQATKAYESIRHYNNKRYECVRSDTTLYVRIKES